MLSRVLIALLVIIYGVMHLGVVLDSRIFYGGLVVLGVALLVEVLESPVRARLQRRSA